MAAHLPVDMFGHPFLLAALTDSRSFHPFGAGRTSQRDIINEGARRGLFWR